MTPFFDTDAIAVTKAYAQKNGLTSMEDLKKVSHFTLGARPEFKDRAQGAAGMKQEYDLNNFTFKSLAFGLQYQALDSGKIDAGDVFTTDPQLASGKYVLLKDPKNIFGFQNIALVIDKQKLAALGGDQFMAIINKVNSLLTNKAVITMNKAVAISSTGWTGAPGKSRYWLSRLFVQEYRDYQAEKFAIIDAVWEEAFGAKPQPAPTEFSDLISAVP